MSSINMFDEQWCVCYWSLRKDTRRHQCLHACLQYVVGCNRFCSFKYYCFSFAAFLSNNRIYLYASFLTVLYRFRSFDNYCSRVSSKEVGVNYLAMTGCTSHTCARSRCRTLVSAVKAGSLKSEIHPLQWWAAPAEFIPERTLSWWRVRAFTAPEQQPFILFHIGNLTPAGSRDHFHWWRFIKAAGTGSVTHPYHMT